MGKVVPGARVSLAVCKTPVLQGDRRRERSVARVGA